VIWQKAASPIYLPCCGECIHPLRASTGKQCPCLGALQCAGTCPPQKCPFG